MTAGQAETKVTYVVKVLRDERHDLVMIEAASPDEAIRKACERYNIEVTIAAERRLE